MFRRNSIDPRLIDDTNWVQKLPGQEAYRLTDPLFGVQLDSNEPPPFLATEPRFQKGFDFWDQNGSEIHLTPFLVRHTRAEDLGEEGKFEAVIGQFPFFGYELMGLTAKGEHQELRRTARAIRTLGKAGLTGLNDYLEYMDGRRPDDSFVHRLNRLIVLNRNTQSIPIDLRGDGTPLERQLLAVEDAWDEQYGLDNDEAALRRGAAFDNAREWVMAANLGLELKCRLGGQIGEQIEVAVMLGGGHRDFVRKIRCLGGRATTIVDLSALSRSESDLSSKTTHLKLGI